MFGAGGQLEVVGRALATFAQHDVDGAGNGACARFCRRRTQDLDALHLFGGELLNGEAGRHAFAVEQDLRVAIAQAPHADLPTAPRRTAQCHARQAFEHIANRGIALFFNVVTANDNFAGGGLAPLLGVVVAVAADLDAPQVGHARRGGLRPGGHNTKRQPRPDKGTGQRVQGMEFRHAPILTAPAPPSLKRG